jgi:methionyl-tRNA formyltransferase
MLLSPSEDSKSLEGEVKAQGGRLIRVQNLNGEPCRQALQASQVDVMVLAGTPIIRASILKIPRVGTINAHQGPLPRFRGMNVIEWSILEGVQPALTVHFVDPGVDTGDIIDIVPIPIFEGDTLIDVRQRASSNQPEILAKTVAALLSGSVLRRSQSRQDGKQYFIMHPRIREIAERRLQYGLKSSQKWMLGQIEETTVMTHTRQLTSF